MGGSIGGSPFGRGKKSISCMDLIIKTQLYSPNPAIIDLITIGTILELNLESSAGPCVAMFNGVVAGTILNSYLLALIDCMQKGIKYIAVVRSIKGGNCAVTIKCKET